MLFTIPASGATACVTDGDQRVNEELGEETETQLRRRLHGEQRSELLERQRSNSESYDKAILTLSSGALGLSLTFIKDLLPASRQPVWTNLLYWSWGLLTGAIIITVVSFLLSSAAINQALNQITEYYLNGNESAFTRTKLSWAVDASNYISGGLFVAGILVTVLFVSINFSEVRSMKTSKTDMVNLSGGHAVPNMQKVATGDLKRGQAIPQMQQVIPDSAATTSPGSSATSAATAPQKAVQPVGQSATQPEK